VLAAPLPLEPRVAPTDVRTAFLSSHPGSTWRVEGDVMVVEMSPRGRCHDALATKVQAFTFDGPAFFAVHDLARAASSEMGSGIPPAIVGGPPEVGEAVTLSRTTVRVRAESATVSELLFAISRQVPGLGWAARETVMPAANGHWPPGPRCVIDVFTSRVWLPPGFELHPPKQEPK